MATETPDESAPIEDIAATLVANHRDLLAFVEKRVGNRATAEEIVRDFDSGSFLARAPSPVLL